MKGTIVIAGGGTGGHIFPGIAVSEKLIERGYTIKWLGVKGGMEEKLVPAAGIELTTIEFAKPTGGLGGLAVAAMKAKGAAGKAREVLKTWDPKAVLGMGGYPSLPGVLAALSLRIPRMIHEQNCKMGIANKALAPIANHVFLTFAETSSLGKSIVTGLPLRGSFANVEPLKQRFQGRSGGLQYAVFGGSHGSLSLNAGVPAAIGQSLNKPEKIFHQCGANNLAATTKAYASAGLEQRVEIREFVDDMPSALAKADLVICRAGASTIAELCAVGTASILVPYPHANAHQDANADVLVAAKAARKISDGALMGGDEMVRILGEFSSRLTLANMAQSAFGLAKPDAAETVAAACEEIINEA